MVVAAVMVSTVIVWTSRRRSRPVRFDGVKNTPYNGLNGNFLLHVEVTKQSSDLKPAIRFFCSCGGKTLYDDELMMMP